MSTATRVPETVTISGDELSADDASRPCAGTGAGIW